jgi:hypothetical protein
MRLREETANGIDRDPVAVVTPHLTQASER